MKNNYKFVNALKEIVSVPTVSITELDKAVNVHLPSDVQKQATRPCKVSETSTVSQFVPLHSLTVFKTSSER